MTSTTEYPFCTMCGTLKLKPLAQVGKEWLCPICLDEHNQERSRYTARQDHRHPIIDAMADIAFGTPNPCEGSRGHMRSDTAWDVAEDYRTTGDPDYICEAFEIAARWLAQDAKS